MKHQLSQCIRRIVSMFLCMALVLTVAAPTAVFAQETDKKTVRIGYYENDTFQSGAADNLVKTGYSYEYMQRVQLYTNWEYEYVYGEYGELYDALLAGEIDLLTGLAYREERVELLNYPVLSMGNTPYTYLKKADRTDITSNSKTISGKKIGSLDGAMAGIVQSYLDENEITADIVLFTDLQRRNQALLDGDVDIIIVEGESTGAMEGVEAFAQAGQSDYYVVVAKERTDVLEELNHAQTELFKASPDLANELNEKWMRQNAVSTTQTDHDRQWISEHKTFTVAYYNNFLPYSDTDGNGNVTGIVKDIIPEILKVLNVKGVEPVYKGYDTFEEMVRALQNGEADVVFPALAEYWSAEKYNVMPTDGVISTYFDFVCKNSGLEMKDAVFAIPESNALLNAFAMVAFTGNEIKYYDTIQSCLDAVVSGEADAALVNGLRTPTLILQKDSYKTLKTKQVAGVALLGFAARRDDSNTVEFLIMQSVCWTQIMHLRKHISMKSIIV